MKQADTVLKDEKLREMFKRCFLSTLETSVKQTKKLALKVPIYI